MSRKTTGLFLFAALLIQAKMVMADPIQAGEHLTLEKCLDIARKTNPTILITDQAIKVSESQVGQARAGYYPQLNGSTGYSRSGTDSTAGTLDNYTAGVSLTQNIYDFGKTSNWVNTEKFNLNAVIFDRDDTSRQVVFAVKEAYFQVIQTDKAREVAKEAVKQFQQHLEQAQAFYQAGTHPKFDVTKAEVDLSNARLDLIKAENAYRLALVNLNTAMGVPDAPEYSLEDNISSPQGNDITLEKVLETAYQNRPDLKAAAERRKSAGVAVALAVKGYFPTLSGSAGYNWSGEDFPLQDEWNAGVAISFPIFDGLSTHYKINEAKSNLKTAEAREEVVKQQAFLEIKQAYLNFQEAKESLPVAEMAVKQAEENLELANGRYKVGVGSPTEVTDAQVAYSQARYAHIQALYGYQITWASIENAVGVK
ncbi:MAG: TolC family protein [Candidatus Omnitrophota bacterium]